MQVIRFICPFIYSVAIGGAWSLWFRKKFSSSLAPAFMLHVLLVLLSGLIFEHLSIGIWGGCSAAIILVLVFTACNRKAILRLGIKGCIGHFWDNGLFTFAFFYAFCYLTNFNKQFTAWDEFSHWGMFIKENLRLDSLYCMSPLAFAHKDYVPAVTLFETIWCKLNFRYAESDVYRGIQIFMFSMLMPMFERFSTFVMNKSCKDGITNRIKGGLFQLSSVMIVLLIPLLFNNSHAFCFYHSIYCDVVVGIILYWCVFEAYREYQNTSYQILVLTIGLTVLVLSKMVAMALMPLVIAFYFVKTVFFSDQKLKGTQWMYMIPLATIPVSLWLWFNAFVDKFVENVGDIQSYDGMKLSILKEVFTSPENSAISYLKELKDSYIEAIIHRDILIHGSYVVVLLFAFIAFFIMAGFVKTSLTKRKIVISGVWTVASGVFYAFLMFFLYATAFSEYEALKLASFERYMNSFIIAVVLFLTAVYYDSGIWILNIRGYYCLLLVLFIDLAFFHVNAFDQVLPGNITHDDREVQYYTTSSDAICTLTKEDESIYFIQRGDDRNYYWHLFYYCSPRLLGGGSIGPEAFKGDIWSVDLTVEEFIEDVRNYDYIYFCGIDEAFVEKYSEAFDDPSQVVNVGLYKICGIDTKIKMENRSDW